MIAFALLALAALTTGAEEQAWINQLREADRLTAEGRYDEADAAYIAARKQAELLGAGELPMAITLNRIGYQRHIAGRLGEAERAYAAALTIVDMVKSADRWMTIEGIELVHKSGGKSGTLDRPQAATRPKRPRPRTSGPRRRP